MRLVEGETALDRFDLGRRAVERARECDVERRAAPFEHARELADATVRDGERRAVVADRHCDEGRRAAVRGRCERAKQRERFEVDPGERDAGLLAGTDIPLDELAVDNDEQDALDALPLRVDVLVENAEVEHCFIERDGQRLLRAEVNRVGELLVFGDADDVEDADADAIARDAEPDALLRKLVACEEALERLAERFRIAKLSTDDDSGRRAPRGRAAAPRRRRCSRRARRRAGTTPIFRPTSFLTA